MSLSRNPALCWLDVETTGLNDQDHEIIEICVVSEAGMFEKKFKPLGACDPGAARVNGYSAEAWEAAGAEEWTIDDLLQIGKVIDGKIPAGCNVSFDLGFLSSYYARARDVEKDFPIPKWSHRKADIQALAMPLFLKGEIKSTALAKLCDFFGVEAQTFPHTAYGDVVRSMEVFDKLCERYGIGL